MTCSKNHLTEDKYTTTMLCFQVKNKRTSALSRKMDRGILYAFVASSEGGAGNAPWGRRECAGITFPRGNPFPC
jgi:hypothetical protein